MTAHDAAVARARKTASRARRRGTRGARRNTRAGDAGLVDLRVFLYSGTVRDKDPDWFFLFEDPSDVSCQLTVETGDTQEVRLSDILLNSNEPVFKMFFEFGCHAVWKSTSASRAPTILHQAISRR